MLVKEMGKASGSYKAVWGRALRESKGVESLHDPDLGVWVQQVQEKPFPRNNIQTESRKMAITS